MSFLLSFSAFSSIEVIRRDKAIVMSGAKCDELKTEVEAIKNWSESMGESVKCSVAYSEIQETGKCEVDISSCVPLHVSLFQDNKSKFRGPNCWNLSLLLSKIVPAMRYSQPKEMSFYMRAPLCRNLLNGEQRKPGDIGVIRRVNDRKLLRPASFNEVHGFIYVSDNLVYSKNGMGEFVPFRLQDFEGVLTKYKVSTKPDCRSNELDTDSKCGVATAYYRCDSFKGYLENNKTIPKEILQEIKVMENFEMSLEKQTINDRILSKENRLNLVKSIKELTEFVEDKVDEDITMGMSTEDKNFILGSIQMKLDGITSQLEYNKEDKFMANLRSMTQDMDDIFLRAGVKKYRNN